MENKDNFTTEFKELSFQDKEGSWMKPNETSSYLTKLQKEYSVDERADIGDIVKIKGANYLIEIRYVEYEIPNFGKVDYAGVVVDSGSEELRLFNQHNIEEIVERKKSHGL